MLMVLAVTASTAQAEVPLEVHLLPRTETALAAFPGIGRLTLGVSDGPESVAEGKASVTGSFVLADAVLLGLSWWQQQTTAGYVSTIVAGAVSGLVFGAASVFWIGSLLGSGMSAGFVTMIATAIGGLAGLVVGGVVAGLVAIPPGSSRPITTAVALTAANVAGLSVLWAF